MKCWEGEGLKVLAKKIEVIAWFKAGGAIRPIRFRIQNEDKTYQTIRVDKILSVDKEKLAGNFMYLYRCQSVIDGVEKYFELKYELDSCEWMLFKM